MSTNIKFYSYNPPFIFSNGHLQTIYPTLFRKLDSSFYQRERITTPDDDFLDLDWSRVGSRKLAIITHGLEGSSRRGYVVGMVRALNNAGYDALAWNFRGCGGEINRQLRFYHNGDTGDLDHVIRYVAGKNEYDSIYLIGFSMGGNITLMYLGDESISIPVKVRAAAAFSVACDAKSSALELEKFFNKKIYLNRFLKKLHNKIKAKMALYPDEISDKGFEKIKNFRDFDDRYTAPLHGFKGTEDYWKKTSSKQFVPSVRIPTLLVNAKNDPFLTKLCYPIDEAAKNQNVSLEMPKSGGHVGFIEFNKENFYWSERRAVSFFDEIAVDRVNK